MSIKSLAPPIVKKLQFNGQQYTTAEGFSFGVFVDGDTIKAGDEITVHIAEVTRVDGATPPPGPFPSSKPLPVGASDISKVLTIELTGPQLYGLFQHPAGSQVTVKYSVKDSSDQRAYSEVFEFIVTDTTREE
ncbi:hypothetical protein [Pseudomonas sp. Ps21-P2]|uniref:hypothetical protein n=1 Tax=Pseudomonas sp. Ps21-P2 TaxID=3080331 RepID=UPI0032098A29